MPSAIFTSSGFVKAEQERIRQGVEPRFVQPSPAGIARPSVNTQAAVTKVGLDGFASVGGRSVGVDPRVVGRDQIDDVRADRGSAFDAGAAYVSGGLATRKGEFKRVEKTLSTEPTETLDHVRGTESRSIGKALLGDGVESHDYVPSKKD